MSFPYKHVLMIGATSGIGKGMADQLASSGVKVTAVGRRKDRLDDFVRQHGSSIATAAPFDITKLQQISGFAEDLIKKSPDIDCLFLNAGTQGTYDLANPQTIDFAKFNNEMTINYTSLVALTFAFLPFLKSKSKETPTSVIFTGTHISIIPAVTVPGYSASKSALNVFTLCLREQLKAASSTVKIIEIYPPVVQTEIHDYMGVETGRSFGMPLDKFTEEAWEGLVSGSDEIIIGGPPPEPRERYLEVVERRRAHMEGLAAVMRKMAASGK